MTNGTNSSLQYGGPFGSRVVMGSEGGDRMVWNRWTEGEVEMDGTEPHSIQRQGVSRLELLNSVAGPGMLGMLG